MKPLNATPATLASCPPRYGTRANPKAKHRLAHFRALAVGLGIELMPWQSLVLRVASEMNKDGSPRYRQITVIVPRQCGKSTLATLLVLERMLLHQSQPQMIAFTAQNLVEGITFWAAQPLEKMKAGGLMDAAGLRLYATTAAPKLRSAKTGSQMRILAPLAQSAAHGQTYHMALIDEAWTFRDDTIENGLLPAMRTVSDPMFVVTSTVGTNASSYLREKSDRGRATLTSTKRTETAYFEWSAPPDADIEDPEVWRKAIPAWGHTVDEDTMRYEKDTATENNFRRSALNQWVDLSAEEEAIPRGAWLECQARRLKLADPVHLAVDASPERRRAAVAACDGAGKVELAHWEAGTDWVLDWLVAACKKNKVSGISYAKGGPLAGIEAALKAANLPLRPLDASQFCHASGDFTEALLNGNVSIFQNRVLDQAVSEAVRYQRGDKWRLGRRDLTCDISAVCAAAMAYFAAIREPYIAPVPAAVIDPSDYLPDS